MKNNIGHPVIFHLNGFNHKKVYGSNYIVNTKVLLLVITLQAGKLC